MIYQFSDGSKIEINEMGNTYIGEGAHKVMFSAWSIQRKVYNKLKVVPEYQQVLTTLCREIEKQGKAVLV